MEKLLYLYNLTLENYIKKDHPIYETLFLNFISKYYLLEYDFYYFFLYFHYCLDKEYFRKSNINFHKINLPEHIKGELHKISKHIHKFDQKNYLIN